MFRIRLFGAPQIEKDGQSIQIGRRKSIALLTYLVVTKRTHSRDTLATMFWPENDQSRARANLRRNLSRLKKDLGKQILEVEREHVGLKPDADLWLDIDAFERRLATTRKQEFHNHEAHLLCNDCQAALTEAADLYAADFLAGFSLPDNPGFDEWQFFQAEGFRQALVEVLDSLIQWHLSQQEYETGIEYARRWLALDPLHEPAHRALMRLYALSGQQAAALRQYQECLRLLEQELGIEPDEETNALYEAIKTRGIAPPAGDLLAPEETHPAQHNIPGDSTSFVGRTAEIEEITALLENPDCRLLTITGPGGMGKTRISTQVASKMLPSFPDGSWFVPLAALTSAEAISSAISSSLNLSPSSQADAKEQLINYLDNKETLLILDNFEHLLPEGVETLIEVLEKTAKPKLLVTSRERLNLLQEWVYEVHGLAVPPVGMEEEIGAPAALRAFDAIRLFVERGRRIKADFSPSIEDIAAIARICQLVEGMPLGLELAAAWLEMLSLEEIVAEIERSLDFLQAQWRDLPARQRSLRAVFESSWQLLEEEEREVIRGLSIFQGSFRREAAQAVTGATLVNLLALSHKSWLQRYGEDRYHLHELLRQYALQELQLDSEAWRKAKDKHAEYYAAFLEEQDEFMKGPQQKKAFQAVAEEYENIVTAWHWLQENGSLTTAIQRMLPALYRYCEARSKGSQLLKILESAQVLLIASGEPVDSHLQAVLLTAKAAFFRNGYPVRLETFGFVLPADEEAVRQAWALVCGGENVNRMGFWGVILSYLYGRLVNQSDGVARMREMLPYLEKQELHWELAFALQHLTLLMLLNIRHAKERVETIQHLEKALEIFQDLGDERESGCTLRYYGQCHQQEQRFRAAIEHWLAAQEKLKAAGEWAIVADIHNQLGDAYLQLGEFEAAFHHFESQNRAYLEQGVLREASYTISKESFEALRYSDFEHALKTRRQSLALSEQVGDSFSTAWNSWEMGEVQRVGGDYEAARDWYERARKLFVQIPDKSGMSFYHRGLGDIACGQKNYPESKRQFQESLKYAKETQHHWAMTYALTGLGRAATGLEQYEAAQRYLLEALKTAKKTSERGIALVALTGFAGWLAATREFKRAIEVSTIVKNHYASWRETKAQAEAVLSSAAERIRDKTVAIPNMDQTTDLWGVIDQLMADFGVPDSS